MNLRLKRGFTIVEMLVVIAVMAIIATLVVTAVRKSLIAMRDHRIKSTVETLEMALNNYYSQRRELPFRMEDLNRVAGNDNLYRISGEKNALVFGKLLQAGGTYLDSSGLLASVNGKRMTAKKALEDGYSSIPIGYPLPTNTSEFRFFTVTYNLTTQTIKVTRSD